MPLEWVPPEVFLRHESIVVYYTYKDDEAASGTRDNIYTLCSSYNGDDGRGPETGVFDVLELPEAVPDGYRVDEHDHARAIKYHIDRGYFNEWERDETDPEEESVVVDEDIAFHKVPNKQLGDDTTAWGIERTIYEDVAGTRESHTELIAIVSTETAANRFIALQGVDVTAPGTITVPVALAQSIYDYLLSCTHGADFAEQDSPEPGVDECRKLKELLDAYRQ